MKNKIIFIIIIGILIAAIVKLNAIEFTPLVNSEGKTFAKARVVQVVKDNTNRGRHQNRTTRCNC